MAKKRVNNKEEIREPVANCDQSKEVIANAISGHQDTILGSQFVTPKDMSKVRTLPYAFTRRSIGRMGHPRVKEDNKIFKTISTYDKRNILERTT